MLGLLEDDDSFFARLPFEDSESRDVDADLDFFTEVAEGMRLPRTPVKDERRRRGADDEEAVRGTGGALSHLRGLGANELGM